MVSPGNTHEPSYVFNDRGLIACDFGAHKLAERVYRNPTNWHPGQEPRRWLASEMFQLPPPRPCRKACGAQRQLGL